jgi:hypothetical protein
VKEAPGTYNEIWWEPKGWADEKALQTSPCLDKSSHLGDDLEASAQGFADGWPSRPLDERYGSYRTACEDALERINVFLRERNLPVLTLAQIDAGARPPSLPGVEGYETALKSFWSQRATAIGVYVHTKVGQAFAGRPGFTVFPINNAGPDFKYDQDDRTAYFELMPSTPSSLKKHANRAMNTFLYRAVFYNRTAVNQWDEEEPL